MSIKGNIKKIILLSLGVLIALGLLVLLIAAINKKNEKDCTGVEVVIDGTGKYNFLTRQDVLAIIAPDKTKPLKGRSLASFDLKKMELAVRRNVWVKNAELFFDNNGKLRLNIEEREPLARIFTVQGNSYYIDSTGKRLPLNDKMAVKLPLFTNFPSERIQLHGADSLLMQQVKDLSSYIIRDSFWMAAIAQIDITPGNQFEMIPVMGNHTIVFGDGTAYEQKFHRLLLFYQQVAAGLGFDKYNQINVQYEGQVIATRKGTIGKIDSIQAMKNIQKMIESSRQAAFDTVSTMVDNNIVLNAASEPPLSTLSDTKRKPIVHKPSSEVPTSPHPSSMKSHRPFPSAQQGQKPVVNQKPKAVMRAG